jgi:hypothetical protein
MSSNPKLYDVIVSPVITEKSTMASENNQVMFNVSPTLPSRRSSRLSKRCFRSR